MTPRRALTISSVLLTAAAAALWGSSRMTWVAVVTADGLSPQRHLSASGQQWAGALTPLALVLLAAIAAAVAVHGRARRLVAVLVAIVGVAATLPAIGILTSDPDVAHAEQVLDLPHKDVIVDIAVRHAAPVVALLGSLLAIVAAVALVRGGHTEGAPEAGMDGRYLTPAARRAALEKRVFAEARESADAAPVRQGDDAVRADAVIPAAARSGSETGVDDHDEVPGVSERDLWDALDTGTDPTDGTPNDRPTRSGR